MTRVVKWCKRQGLNIVLDLHKAYGYDFNNAGDKKKNIVGIWTPPLCAEYHTAGTSEMLKETIYTQSLATIEETSFKKLVVCDPFAWKALKDYNYPEEKMVYFADILY